MSSDWLMQLAPEHAPPAPGWWPPAPGWWLLVLLCVAIAVTAAWWRRDPHRRWRRAALRELDQLKETSIDNAQTACALQRLLRRYALAVFGVERVGRLSGAAWLRFLGEHGGESLAGDTGGSLLAAAFSSSAASERDRWIAAADAFIRTTASTSRQPSQ